MIEPQVERTIGSSSRHFTIVGVPSSAGARRPGLEGGPEALRAADLVSCLRALGHRVTDGGDLPRVEFRPDPDNPGKQNVALVCGVVRDLAARMEAATEVGSMPIVLGGDCTITIGVVAGLLEKDSSLGLVYLDGDLDLNTPETTVSGFFDGMVAAHLLGRGAPELARVGKRYPLLEESHLVFFGYNERGGGIDPPELSVLERSATRSFSVEMVRHDPLRSAREALAALTGLDRILVHFDLDVTDIPSVDVPHQYGLSLDTAASVLGVFLSSPKCAGLVVTEFNPLMDEDGTRARRVVELLTRSLAAPSPNALPL